MLKVGFYEKDITPPLGDDIPGYSGPRNSTAIHDPVYAKAISLSTGDAVHECIIMITVDLIYVPPYVYDVVMDKVERFTGVPQKNIMIAATHSHTSGPIYDDGGFRIPDEPWMKITAQSTADAAITAFQRMKPGSARYASAVVEGLAYCRDFVMKDGSIRTNPAWQDPNIVRPAGKTDPEFPVAFFFDDEDKPIGAVCNYSCHHDSKSGTEISADYSGVLAAGMKDEFGRDFVNILFQGPSGNINHCNPFREKKEYDEPNYQRIGKALIREELRLFKEAQPLEIEAVFSEKRMIPIERRDVPDELVDEYRWVLENAPVDWYQMNINAPENQMFKLTHARAVIKLSQSHKYHPGFIQVAVLGDLAIYALPGEQYAEYGLYIKEKSPAKYNMVSGTAHKGVRGYIPTPELYGSTSYAVQFGSTDVVPEAGQIMADAVLKLAEEIKNQI